MTIVPAVLAALVGGYAGWIYFKGKPDLSFIPMFATADYAAIGAENRPSSEEQAILRPNNAVSKQAYDWGMRTCLGAIGTVSDFLTAGRSFAALSQRGPGQADEQMFTAMVAVRGTNTTENLSTMMAAPARQGCSASYQTLATFTQSCDATRLAYFGGFPNKVELGEGISGYGNGKSAFVFFMPVGDLGCAVLKNEVIYRAE